MADQIPSIKLEIEHLLARANPSAYVMVVRRHKHKQGPTTEESRKLNERIRQLHALGMNFGEVATKLNEEGYKTALGGPFNNSACAKRWAAYEAFLASQKERAEISRRADLILLPAVETTPGPRLVTLSIPETLPEAAEPPKPEAKKFGPGNPKIPHSEDDLIFNLRKNGKTLRDIATRLVGKGVDCTEQDVSYRLKQIRERAAEQPAPTAETAGTPARDEAAINRTIHDMHERGKTDLEISVFLSNNVGGPWLPDEVARRLKGMGASE